MLLYLIKQQKCGEKKYFLANQKPENKVHRLKSFLPFYFQGFYLYTLVSRVRAAAAPSADSCCF